MGMKDKSLEGQTKTANLCQCYVNFFYCFLPDGRPHSADVWSPYLAVKQNLSILSWI